MRFLKTPHHLKLSTLSQKDGVLWIHLFGGRATPRPDHGRTTAVRPRVSHLLLTRLTNCFPCRLLLRRVLNLVCAAHRVPAEHLFEACFEASFSDGDGHTSTSGLVSGIVFGVTAGESMPGVSSAIISRPTQPTFQKLACHFEWFTAPRAGMEARDWARRASCNATVAR